VHAVTAPKAYPGWYDNAPLSKVQEVMATNLWLRSTYNPSIPMIISEYGAAPWFRVGSVFVVLEAVIGSHARASACFSTSRSRIKASSRSNTFQKDVYF
jgi:hypothetical protein